MASRPPYQTSIPFIPSKQPQISGLPFSGSFIQPVGNTFTPGVVRQPTFGQRATIPSLQQLMENKGDKKVYTQEDVPEDIKKKFPFLNRQDAPLPQMTAPLSYSTVLPGQRVIYSPTRSPFNPQGAQVVYTKFLGNVKEIPKPAQEKQQEIEKIEEPIQQPEPEQQQQPEQPENDYQNQFQQEEQLQQ